MSGAVVNESPRPVGRGRDLSAAVIAELRSENEALRSELTALRVTLARLRGRATHR